MHEVSLMQQAVGIAVDHAERNGCSRVLAVKMRVGDLSGVVPDALDLAFAVSSRGTIVEGAELQIETVAVECVCEPCGGRFEPRRDCAVYRCPICNTTTAKVVRGREFAVASIEVD